MWKRNAGNTSITAKCLTKGQDGAAFEFNNSQQLTGISVLPLQLAFLCMRGKHQPMHSSRRRQRMAQWLQKKKKGGAAFSIKLTFTTNLFFFILQGVKTEHCGPHHNPTLRCVHVKQYLFSTHALSLPSSFAPHYNQQHHLTLLQRAWRLMCGSTLQRVPRSRGRGKKKNKSPQSRGAAAAAVWGRHPASKGLGDVAPYQSDGADLIARIFE